MKKIPLCAALLLALISSCAKSTPSNEELFKNNAAILSEVLDSLKNSNGVIEKRKLSDNDDVLLIERNKSAEYLKKKKKELLNLEESFNAFPVHGNHTIWDDDAIFCKTLLYLFVFKPYDHIFNKDNSFLIKIIFDSHFVIESWTKEKLGQYYNLFLDLQSSNYSMTHNDSEIIKAGVASFVASNFCLNNELDGAIEILKRCKTENCSPVVFKSMETIIKACQGGSRGSRGRP